jgi:GNAT superfamily N-acetyltransferase
MRHFINILTENSLDRIVQERTRAWREITERSTKFAERWKTPSDMVNEFAAMDKSPSRKYTSGLITLYFKDPWNLATTGYVEDVLDGFYKIAKGTKLDGEVVNLDLASYSSLRDVSKIVSKFLIKTHEKRNFEKNSFADMKIYVQKEGSNFRDINVKNRKGDDVGNFVIDLSYRERGIATMHSELETEYQGKGYGAKIYDWVEKYVSDNMGLKLRPSDHLTQSSYNLWKKRNPEYLEHHIKKSEYLEHHHIKKSAVYSRIRWGDEGGSHFK